MYGNRYKDFANNTDIYYNGYITNWCAVKRSIILWNWFKNLKMVKLLSMGGEILSELSDKTGIKLVVIEEIKEIAKKYGVC